MQVPWTHFKASWRGQLVRDAPPLTGAALWQLGLMVSKFTSSGGVTPGFTAGPFRLLLRTVRAYTTR